MEESQLSWRVTEYTAHQEADSLRACAQQGTQDDTAWGVYIR